MVELRVDGSVCSTVVQEVNARAAMPKRLMMMVFIFVSMLVVLGNHFTNSAKCPIPEGIAMG